MDTLYIETTVIGNIAGRTHPDPVVAARQQLTRVWWSTARDRYSLFVSQLTLQAHPESARAGEDRHCMPRRWL